MAVAELLRSLKNVTSDDPLSITVGLNAKLKGHTCVHVYMYLRSMAALMNALLYRTKSWDAPFEVDMLNEKAPMMFLKLNTLQETKRLWFF